ncbi:unnamed protein product [Orchesella dallaii]|uniref:Uncharacterized protein n=1 Tax=Orchesella dallaii TaxID=48710 RepID=A0ABP1S9X2_9HEXA
MANSDHPQEDDHGHDEDDWSFDPSESIGLVDDSRLSLAASRVVQKAMQHVGAVGKQETFNESRNVNNDHRNNDGPVAVFAPTVENPNPYGVTAEIQVFEEISNVTELESSQMDTDTSPRLPFSPLLVPLSADNRESISISEASSMQVLVPVHPFPDESEVKLEETKRLLEQHVTQIESVLPGGFEIHRNQSNPNIPIIKTRLGAGNELPQAIISSGNIFPVGNDGAARAAENNVIYGDTTTAGNIFPVGNDGVATAGENRAFYGNSTTTTAGNNLIEEMANYLAAEALSLQYISVAIQPIVAETGRIVSQAGDEATRFNTGGLSAIEALPAEVKEYILGKLADIKAQLDLVKRQLQEQGLFQN